MRSRVSFWQNIFQQSFEGVGCLAVLLRLHLASSVPALTTLFAPVRYVQAVPFFPTYADLVPAEASSRF